MTEPLSVPLESVDGPIARCETCGNELLGSGRIEHNADGSHDYFPPPDPDEVNPPDDMDPDVKSGVPVEPTQEEPA